MVDLGGGQDGPIEHGFSNSVFILPGIVFVALSGEYIKLFNLCIEFIMESSVLE